MRPCRPRCSSGCCRPARGRAPRCRAARSRRPRRPGSRPTPSSPTDTDERLVVGSQRHDDVRGLRVADAVGQRLLDDAIRRRCGADRSGRRAAPETASSTGTRERRVKSRASHSSAGCRPKSSSMLGRRPSARSRTVCTMLSTSCRHSATVVAERDVRGLADAFDAPELHPQRRQHLADVIVQLARQLAALFLLRRHQLLRQLAQLLFGFLRAFLLLLRSGARGCAGGR